MAILVLDEGWTFPFLMQQLCVDQMPVIVSGFREESRFEEKNPHDDSRALIIDFILDLSPFSVEVREKLRKKYTSEVKRIQEFGKSSDNSYGTVLQRLEESRWTE